MGTPKAPLTDPKVFLENFCRFANARAPRRGKARLATSWFERLMVDLAGEHGLYCQNKQKRGEWMCVDHVFVEKNAYNHFPIVAVEHENGDLSGASKSGGMPGGDARGAYIEWAAWKALTMRAKLHVLVAYPWQRDRAQALSVLTLMTRGFVDTFGTVPNALFLLGWWGIARTDKWRAENLYEGFVPVPEKGKVVLRSLTASDS